jgi:hypothetical protein
MLRVAQLSPQQIFYVPIGKKVEVEDGKLMYGESGDGGEENGSVDEWIWGEVENVEGKLSKCGTRV